MIVLDPFEPIGQIQSKSGEEYQTVILSTMGLEVWSSVEFSCVDLIEFHRWCWPMSVGFRWYFDVSTACGWDEGVGRGRLFVRILENIGIVHQSVHVAKERQGIHAGHRGEGRY